MVSTKLHLNLGVSISEAWQHAGTIKNESLRGFAGRDRPSAVSIVARAAVNHRNNATIPIGIQIMEHARMVQDFECWKNVTDKAAALDLSMACDKLSRLCAKRDRSDIKAGYKQCLQMLCALRGITVGNHGVRYMYAKLCERDEPCKTA